VLLEPRAPLVLQLLAARARIATLPGVLGDHERRILPPEILSSRHNLLRAERRAVRRLGALLVRRAPADDGLAANETRAILFRLRGDDGALDCRRIVTVDIRHDVPAVGFEALRRVVGKPPMHFAVDGDSVV